MTTTASGSAAKPAGRRRAALATKLTAAVAVPLVLLTVAAALLFADRLSARSSASADANLADINQRVEATLVAAHAEQAQVAGGQPKPSTANLDRAARELRSDVEATELPAGAMTTSWRSAAGQLKQLSSVRASAGSDQAAAVDRYSTLTGALLGFERAVLSAAHEPALATRGAGLAELASAREQLATRHATLLNGITQGKLTRPESVTLRDAGVRFDAASDRFRAVAGDRDRAAYDRGVHQADVDRLDGVVDTAMKPGPITVKAGDWNQASGAVARQLRGTADGISGQLRADAADARDAAGTAAIVTGVVALVVIVAAAILAVLACRRVLRAVRALHRGARTVANTTLPQALADLRSGKPVDTEVEPLAVPGGDELGQVARAFDAVHAEARGLAAAQANMRESYGTIFVNLSRRSQTLVQRQLRMIEQLERDEEDPEQLGTLFALDHLATRMRRNNENLMVLSGAEPNRGQTQQPVPLEDVLRAAVSEIEQYRRVLLEPPPSATVLGYTAGDLVRLIAELLDNATAFSAPDTTVTVTTAQDNDQSLLIRIDDGGIGMPAEELAAANERLAAGDTEDVPASRRMGLFVVGRLAWRQGVQVALRAGDQEGTVAGIRIPRRLLAGVTPSDGGLGLDFEQDARDGEATVETVLPQPAQPYDAKQSPQRQRPRTPASTGTASTGTTATSQADAAPEPRTAPDASAAESAAEATGAADPGTADTGETTEHTAPPDAPDTRDTSDRPDTTAGTEHVTPNGQSRRGPRRPAERTPIFDTMLSAWFADPAQEQGDFVVPGAGDGSAAPAASGRGASDSGDAAASAASEAAGEQWRFAADAGWQAVEEVAGVEPESVTEAGLPRRTPRAKLLPGSVPEASEPSGPPKHSADSVRSRLASFQRGVRRGRHSTGTEPPEPVAGEQDGDTELFTPDTPETEPDPIPRQPNGSWAFSVDGEQDETRDPRNDTGGDTGGGTTDPRHGVDTPTEVITPAGLPRRTPRARRPGAVPPAAGPPRNSAQGADANGVRSRLASFQRGLSEGRRSVGIPERELDEDEHAYQWENE